MQYAPKMMLVLVTTAAVFAAPWMPCSFFYLALHLSHGASLHDAAPLFEYLLPPRSDRESFHPAVLLRVPQRQ